jgi:hypothetical protein
MIFYLVSKISTHKKIKRLAEQILSVFESGVGSRSWRAEMAHKEKIFVIRSYLRFAGAVSTAAVKGQVGQQAHNIHHIQSHVIQGVGDGVSCCASYIGGVCGLPEDLFCKLVCS